MTIPVMPVSLANGHQIPVGTLKAGSMIGQIIQLGNEPFMFFFISGIPPLHQPIGFVCGPETARKSPPVPGPGTNFSGILQMPFESGEPVKIYGTFTDDGNGIQLHFSFTVVGLVIK